MFRPVASALSIVALSALAGCASSSQQAVSHSLASQIPTDTYAMAPATDEIQFVSKAPPAPGARRFTKDAELAGSLRADSPTARTTDE